MDLTGVVVGLVGGGTTTAVWTTSHAQAAKDRERMLTAARGFLDAQRSARSGVADLRRRTGEMLNAVQGWTRAREDADEEARKLPAGQAKVELLTALNGVDLTGVAGLRNFDAAIDDESRAKFAEQLAEVRRAADNLAQTAPNAAVAARRAANAAWEAIDAVSNQREAFATSQQSLEQLDRTFPLVRLLFATEGRDDVVVSQGWDAITALRMAVQVILKEQSEGRDPFPSTNVPAQNAFALVDWYANEFAAAANSRITRRWWRRLLQPASRPASNGARVDVDLAAALPGVAAAVAA